MYTTYTRQYRISDAIRKFFAFVKALVPCVLTRHSVRWSPPLRRLSQARLTTLGCLRWPGGFVGRVMRCKAVMQCDAERVRATRRRQPWNGRWVGEGWQDRQSLSRQCV